MGLRFFADHCISNSIIQKLLDADHEVLRLKDHIPIESPDPVVIATAQNLDSILISLNGDFRKRRGTGLAIIHSIGDSLSSIKKLALPCSMMQRA